MNVPVAQFKLPDENGHISVCFDMTLSTSSSISPSGNRIAADVQRTDRDRKEHPRGERRQRHFAAIPNYKKIPQMKFVNFPNMYFDQTVVRPRSSSWSLAR